MLGGMAQHDIYNSFTDEAQDSAPKLSLRDRILGFNDLQKEVVEVPEWGGIKVEVRGLSAKSRARFIKQVQGEDVTGEIEVDIEVLQPAMLILTLHDPDTGEQLFTDADADLLGDKSSAVLDRLFQLAQKLSGMGQEEEKELGKP